MGLGVWGALVERCVMAGAHIKKIMQYKSSHLPGTCANHCDTKKMELSFAD